MHLQELLERTNMAESVLSKFSDELARAAEQAGRSVVTVRARMRVPSSGIVWKRGVIVTANHTIRRDGEISVLLPDGQRAEAKLAGRDPGTDLAILRWRAAMLRLPKLATRVR
jgi:S1-C subfamily serine protease